MKKVILWISAITLLIAAIGLAGYPFISDLVNSMHVQEDSVRYSEMVEDIDDNKYKEMLEDAHIYNQGLVGSTVISDPFQKVFRYPNDYMSMLRVDGTDVMASIEIPKINVNLPIYHTTENEVLEKGVGHLANSSLPVGGKGTHCILSGHTGQSTLRLFSDVNQLETGDVFFIYVLKEKLAYKIDNIQTVLPEKTDAMQIDPNEDYVTLVTCTPFGVNTHRLLVRGRRVELETAEELAEAQDSGDSTWDEEYKKAIFWGIALLFAILLVFFSARFIIRKVRKKSLGQNE